MSKEFNESKKDIYQDNGQLCHILKQENASLRDKLSKSNIQLQRANERIKLLAVMSYIIYYIRVILYFILIYV